MKKLWLGLILIPSLAGASGIYNPGSTGGGGSAGIVSPGTFTWTNPNGMTVPDQTSVSTGVVNLEQLESVANANGIQNGNFVSLPAGLTNPAVGTTIATGWTVANNTNTAGYTTAQESTIVHNAKNSLKVNVVTATIGGSLWIKQAIGNYQEYLGSTVTVTCYLYAATGSPAPLVTAAIQDSVSGSTGTTISADAAWHQVTVSHFVPSNATSLSVWIGMPSNNPLGTGAFYVDNVMLNPSLMPVPYFPLASPIATVGFTDGSSAGSGNAGEYTSVNQGALAFPSSGAWGDLTSLSLTAGDWIVSAQAVANPNGAGTLSDMRIGISVTSGNSGTGMTVPDNQMNVGGTSLTIVFPITIAAYRISLATTTSVYFKYQASYGSGSPQCAGALHATRVR